MQGGSGRRSQPLAPTRQRQKSAGTRITVTAIKLTKHSKRRKEKSRRPPGSDVTPARAVRSTSHPSRKMANGGGGEEKGQGGVWKSGGIKSKTFFKGREDPQ